jgi:hypothetical protein
MVDGLWWCLWLVVVLAMSKRLQASKIKECIMNMNKDKE